ncbi:MAG: hypothetical protein SFX73_27425 [Kofleriaceae bacterium]|nr:hypothetical protein [Kofleriaceae bacterium]
MVNKLALLLLVLAGCGVFEEPSIVIDLRVIGVVADPPEQVIDVDLAQPMPSEIIDALEITDITAWVADPRRTRQLRWSMTLCLVDQQGRCDLTLPHQELGSGLLEDPDEHTSAQRPSASIVPSGYPDTLLAMLQKAIEANPVQALGGIDLTVMLRVGGVDEPPENDLYAAKLVRYSPNYPVGRKETVNKNPTIQTLDAARVGSGGDVDINERRCADPLEPGELATSLNEAASVTLFPIESADTRQMYVAPTLDGGAIMLEETVSYQWLAETGSWSDETTGGGRDILGNQSLLGSDWTSPRSVPTNEYPVRIWMIQRDERLGVNVYETCILVTR